MLETAPAPAPVPSLGQSPIPIPSTAPPAALPAVALGGTAAACSAPDADSHWEALLEAEAQALLANGQAEVWDVLARRFESRLISAALAATHGRRMEAAQRLGIGRNTITRKIQELGLKAHDD